MSLAEQTDPDFEHLIFTDEVARGIPFAQRMLMALVPEAKGRFVFVLDDDDYMVNPNGISIMKSKEENLTEGFIMKADCGHEGILPRSFPGKRITGTNQRGAIGQICYALRRDIFEQSLNAYQGGAVESDQICINYAYNRAMEDGYPNNKFAMIDEVICSAQRVSSRGAPE